MPSVPSARRPGTDTTLGDHERRIRNLERNPFRLPFAIFHATTGAHWNSPNLAYNPPISPGFLDQREVFAPVWTLTDQQRMDEASVVSETSSTGIGTRPDSIVALGRPGRYLLLAGCHWTNTTGASVANVSYADFAGFISDWPSSVSAWHKSGGVWTLGGGGGDGFTIGDNAVGVAVPGDSGAAKPNVYARLETTTYYEFAAGGNEDEGVEFEFRNSPGFTDFASWAGRLVVVRLG